MAEVADRLEADRSFVVPTSGSTGSPKSVVLSSAALRASAESVAERVGGHGQWLAALPTSHVAGLSVFVRSVLAGSTPVQLPAGSSFTPGLFVAATSRLHADRRRYVSLVPTQVTRLLPDPAALDALRSFDRVLIGGASLPSATATTLSAAGIAWSHTYGMSETSGGCVYDGVPLAGVTVRQVDPDNDTNDTNDHRATGPTASGVDRTLLLAGPMLAEGYQGRPDLDALSFEHHDGQRFYRTSDLGHWDASLARWVVVGRVDGVIITGGRKVHPAAVQDVLEDLPGISEAAVVGVPDPQWGHAVAALVVASASGSSAALLADPLGWVRDELRQRLPGYAIPWRVRTTGELPRLPGGKVDSAGVQAAFVQEDDRL